MSRWKEELPSYEEPDEGVANLKRHGNKVDYIVTHSCGARALMYPPLRTRGFQRGQYPENHMLSYLEVIATYRHWYFAHYHMDGRLNDKMTVLYREIVPPVGGMFCKKRRCGAPVSRPGAHFSSKKKEKFRILRSFRGRICDLCLKFVPIVQKT